MSTTNYTATFGSGILIAKNNAAGAQQPIIFGALQDISLEFNGTNAELDSQYQIALLVARSKLKISGKAKMGYLSGPLFNSLYFGTTSSVGTVSLAAGEAGTIPAATPWTITVANSTKFVADQGVVYAATGVPLTPVASAPVAGQYSVAAGVYTFATADAGLAVQISYTYTNATAGSTIVVANPLQGVQPEFSCLVSTGYNGSGIRYMLNHCIASKLTVPSQLGKFAISEFDFDVFGGANNQPLSIYTDG